MKGLITTFSSKGFRKFSQGVILNIIVAIFLLNIFSFRVYAAEEFINQARSVIKNYYIEEVPNDILSKPTIVDIVKSLNDPYSQYITPQEYKELTNGINMKVTGIGVQIDIVPEGVMIISVVDGSPAKEAGLKVGDRITKADEYNLAGLSIEKAASYIKGEEGTSVQLQVKREDKSYTYEVTRKQIAFPTVEGKMLDGSVAYIRISSFGESTSSDFRVKYAELSKYSPQSLIVDIRNNGGGYLSTAIDLLGSFIGERTALITRDRFKGETTYIAPGNFDVIDKPIILLVNEYSASASEILSAALKDYDKAFLIGTRTYGKGTVQTLFELFDDSVLKLTVRRFYSPFGNSINKVGIEPNYEVSGVDSLIVAELLSGSSGISKDKRGFIKITIGNKEFEIDINKARKHEYWPAFRYIINNASLSGYGINVGVGTGWAGLNGYSSEKIYSILYPENRETSELRSVPVDKQFTVTFTSDIDMNTINDKSIELINAASGEHTLVDFIVLDGRRVKVVPKESLKTGNTYYLVVKNNISGKNGGTLMEGTVTKVIVK